MRHHNAGWDVSLLLVDGRKLLLVVGTLLKAAVGVVHRGIWEAVSLGHHLSRSTHLASLADSHVGAALLVAASAILTAVPPVLDGIVTSATQATSDLSPALAHLGDHLLDQSTLFGGNGLMVEVGLEVLVIPLTALLGRTGLDHRGYPYPVVGTLGVDQADEDLVLGLGPGSSLVCRHSDGKSVEADVCE